MLYRKQPKYKLIKLNIGLISALCGVTALSLAKNTDNITVHADEITTTNNNSTQQQNNTNSSSQSNATTFNVASTNNVTNSNNNSTSLLQDNKIVTTNNNELQANKNRFDSNLDNNKYQTDPVTDQAVYNKNNDISINEQITNKTNQDQQINVIMALYKGVDPVAYANYSKYMKQGETVNTQNDNQLKQALTIKHSVLENNQGYLAKIGVYDNNFNLLSSKTMGLSVEDNWKVFPKYGAIAGSGDYSNSILNKPELLNKYNDELQEMSRMHINAHFYYDVYKSPANPIPDYTKPFNQTWSWWSGKDGSTIDPNVVKQMVALGHKYNQKAMLYNMISAKSNDENFQNTPGLPEDSQLVYNFDDGVFGKKGTPMTNTMHDGNPYIAQIYYNPASQQWVHYIGDTMHKALEAGGFDGWQGDTIGDAQVTTFENKGTDDPKKSFSMSSTYDYFTQQLKDYWKSKGFNHDFTLNAVGGNGLIDLSKDEDIAYVEVWPNVTYDGHNESEYGDLKWMVDKVRQASGKSLVIGAYLKNNHINNKNQFDTNAQLLIDATVAAAGGYHMTIVANGANKNGNHVGVLDNEYYPNQDHSVSDDMNRKLYNYQNFITAYQNILRGQGVENDDNIAKTYDGNGKQMSQNDNSSRDSGRSGNQVWTFTKSGNSFKTIQLINLMGINSDWDNTSKLNKKDPTVQNNFTVTYPLNNMSLEKAQELANNVYVMSPDEWTGQSIQKVKAEINNKNGHYDLVIHVPKLEIWDMIYLNLDSNKQQLLNVNFVDENNHKIIKNAIVKGNVDNNNQIHIQEQDAPSGYKLNNTAFNFNPTTMLLTVPVSVNSKVNANSSSATPIKPTGNQNSSSNSSSTTSTKSIDNQNSSSNDSSTTPTKSTDNQNSSSNGSSTAPIKSTDNQNSSSNSSSVTPTKSIDNQNSSPNNSSATPTKSINNQVNNLNDSNTDSNNHQKNNSNSSTLTNNQNNCSVSISNTGLNLTNSPINANSSNTPNSTTAESLTERQSLNTNSINPNNIVGNNTNHNLSQTNVNTEKNGVVMLALISGSLMLSGLGAKKKD